MRRIYVIARREYLAMVATKGFLLGLLIVPLMMLGGLFIPQFLNKQVDLKPKRIMVLGAATELQTQLSEAVKLRNEQATVDADGQQIAPEYQLEYSSTATTDAERYELSERVRKGELAAFLEIPPDLLGAALNEVPPETRLHAENASFSELTEWLEEALAGIVRQHRLRRAGIDLQTVERAMTPAPLAVMDLYEKSATGEILQGGRSDRMFEIFFPLTVMMLMFMVMWMSAQSVLECVLEEKRQRIGEVLLGSATPFELMAGKLLGSVCGSLTMVTIYLGGAIALADYNDYLGRISLSLIPWFIVFQVLAVVMMSSIFLAVAASVTELKEAGGLLMPVWLVFLIPMWSWINIVREPNGPLAVGMSFFPPATPMVMMLRLSASNTVPVWQPWAGAGVVALASIAFVYASSRIFRIGMLTQGKAPKLTELMRWVVRG